MTSTQHTYSVGIIGGGQLARMMQEAAIHLGIHVRLLSEQAGSSAAQVINDVVVGDFTDQATVLNFARGLDAITFDHEHVPTPVLEALEATGVAVRPGSAALVHAQDKAVMRERMDALGAPSPTYKIVPSKEELRRFGGDLGWPIIAKVSRGGYDGKGVWRLEGPDDVDEPFDATITRPGGETDAHDVRILAEECVDFTRELSAIVVRSPSGQAVAYPISETLQKDGICVRTVTPAPGLDPDKAAHLQQVALRIAGELGVVGVLAVELMEARDGRILVNELAMRPHNTGHWTIHGAWTSQFENHLRAVLDLPLGDPGMRAPWAVMENVLGGDEPDLTGALQHCYARDRRLFVELYGKQVRPGRKVGHVTTLGSELDDAERRAKHAADYLMGHPGA